MSLSRLPLPTGCGDHLEQHHAAPAAACSSFQAHPHGHAGGSSSASASAPLPYGGAHHSKPCKRGDAGCECYYCSMFGQMANLTPECTTHSRINETRDRLRRRLQTQSKDTMQRECVVVVVYRWHLVVQRVVRSIGIVTVAQ